MTGYVEKIRSVGTLADLTALLLSDEHRLFGVSPVGIGLGISPQNAELYETDISATPLLLEDSAEYQELSDYGTRLKDFNDGLAAYMLSRFGIPAEEIGQIIKNAYDLERRIAPSIKTVFEKSDSSYRQTTINPVTMDEIRTTMTAYPLAQIMDAAGWSVSERININEPDALKAVNDLYTEENTALFRDWLLVNAAISSASITDEEAFRKYQELRLRMTGASESMPDRELAYQDTRSRFPDSFARLYIAAYLTDEMRQEIRQLCQDTIDTYAEMLAQEDWLSPETRQAAINKVKKIRINALYPDKWDDFSVSFRSKGEGGTFTEALNAYDEAMEAYRLRMVNSTMDKEIWQVDILTTNAFYNPTDNSINIIPGFLCDATYRSDMTIEEKYGALGSVIGHEISHAFDNNGAQYDENGNFSSWWKPEDYEAFSQRAQKLIAYYDQVVAFEDGPAFEPHPLAQSVEVGDSCELGILDCQLCFSDSQRLPILNRLICKNPCQPPSFMS